VRELVKAVDGYVFLYNGEWMHVNFLAKSKQGTPKAFFAELKIEGMKKISCTMCTEMDPGVLILKDILSIFVLLCYIWYSFFGDYK
jgi:hypothetical protein